MTGSTTTGDNAAVFRLIEDQIDLYGVLDELSRRQHRIVETDDTNALLAVLNERGAVIDRIGRLSAQLAPYLAEWDVHVAGLAASDRDRIRRRLDELAVMMQQITRRDEEDRDTLERRRTEVGRELTGLSRGGAALSAYGGSARGPRYQDRRA